MPLYGVFSKQALLSGCKIGDWERPDGTIVEVTGVIRPGEKIDSHYPDLVFVGEIVKSFGPRTRMVSVLPDNEPYARAILPMRSRFPENKPDDDATAAIRRFIHELSRIISKTPMVDSANCENVD
jgi:hypothetical protein